MLLKVHIHSFHGGSPNWSKLEDASIDLQTESSIFCYVCICCVYIHVYKRCNWQISEQVLTCFGFFTLCLCIPIWQQHGFLSGYFWHSPSTGVVKLLKFFSCTLQGFCNFQDDCIKLLYLNFFKFKFLGGIIIKIQEKKIIAWVILIFYSVYWIDQ